ncbi:MAG: hypothetical protein U0T78_00990 [Cloacibacterium normanense]
MSLIPLQTKAGFGLILVMLGVKEGFDIVIGNPLYVQLQKDGGKLAKIYQALITRLFKEQEIFIVCFMKRNRCFEKMGF